MSLASSGATNYVKRTASLPSVTGCTICGWFRVGASPSSGTVILFGEPNHPDYYELSYNAGTGNVLVGSSDDYATWAIKNVGAAGARFFGALTCSGTGAGTVIGYVGQRGDSALSSYATGNRTAFVPQEISFLDNFYGEPFAGDAESLMVFDGALTAAELFSQMHRRVPIKPARMWWPALNDSVSIALKDRSGSGYDLTAVGTLTSSPSAPVAWGARPMVVGHVAAAAAEIEADAEVSVEAAAPLTTEIALSADATIASAATAALHTVIPIGADAEVSADVSADLDTASELQAQAVVTVDASAQLQGSQADLDATADAFVDAAADLSTTIALATTAQVSVVAVAKLPSNGPYQMAFTLRRRRMRLELRA